MDLGTDVARAVIASAGVEPGDVDEVIIGHARQAGSGPNPARQVSIGAGVPRETVAYTVNAACGSGIKSIALGADSIRNDRAHCVVVGGMESMTRVPFMLDRHRTGYRLGNARVLDGMYRDGFNCPIADMVMGETAEVLAREYDISREEQDAWAMMSQNRAERAIGAGVFDDEIVPATSLDEKGRETIVGKDEHPRAGVTMAALGKLPPVFAKDGTVTAGNASGITDGAAALVLGSTAFAERIGREPLGYVADFEAVGVDPKRMGIGPVPATRRLLERTGLSLSDFDAIELNEAFAAQVIACERELSFDRDRVNRNGGAISLGHPIGCTGARIVVTLLHEMRRMGARRGLATLCVSGGLGMAMILEAP